MSSDAAIKALLIAMVEDVEAAAASINRLKPERLCFFLPDSSKTVVEQQMPPKLQQMPQRWDWIVTPDPGRFVASYQAIARALPAMMKTWDVHSGELVAEMTAATPSMAAAMALACAPFCSRLIAADEAMNPWDELAAQSRREACDLFNRGAFSAAGAAFRAIEWRVSGGQKPLYHAFADLADGYACWDRFQYRPAWEKLKGGVKALEMASVWGGPPGLKELLPPIKQNAGFLERLVLDPQDVKEYVVYDLLAHARRRAELDQHHEAAMTVLVRAFEAAAQHRLFSKHKIRNRDAALQAQFNALAATGDPLGQAVLAQWMKLIPFLDAASQGILGHGFEAVKAERFQQLYDLVIKLLDVTEASVPRFPVLALA